MISIAVCEDSVPVQAQLENDTRELLGGCQVEVFSSGEDLLSYISGRSNPFSIYLMDISLPGISGIETAAAIRKQDSYALIIYITDYREYVYQVFETLPYRFITKPVEKTIFWKALSDAVNYCASRRELFHFHIDRVQYQVPMQEITYLESQLRRITLHTARESYTFYGRLGETQRSLNPLFFVRAHASYIVNMEHIRIIRDTQAVLHTGEEIPISRKYRSQMREKHLEYMKWRSVQ